MSSEHTPRITLLGAGPGDPDLISVKGMKALQSADAVLYDALVSRDLLQYVPADAPRIFVGKRADKHKFGQEEINRLLVAYAFNYGHVVRLKGGDPFVFGRGQEEKSHAEAFNIPVEVIPGISSATGVPSSLGIPLTERGINDSFWVLTATKSDGSLSDDVALAVQSTATVVFLMGVRKLPLIAQMFIEQGKADLPVAVIQSGTTTDEKVVTGPMHEIAARAAAAEIGTPGIIIAGPSVARYPGTEELLAAVPAAVRQNHGYGRNA